MTTYYVIQVYDASYTLQASISDYRELAISKRVNEVGRCEFILALRHRARQYLIPGAIVEVIRIIHTGLTTTEYVEFTGYIRKYERRTENVGDSIAIYTCTCPLDILNYRVNAYYAETRGKNLFTDIPIETLMKQFVEVNVGASAVTASGRLRDGTISGFLIAPDQGRGELVDWANAWKTVLPDLQEMAETFKYDYTLTLNKDLTLEFEVYPVSYGTDRRLDFTFSLENGNMARPIYLYDTTDERSVVIAASDGHAGQRRVIVISGENYAADNDREVYSDARHIQVYVGPLVKNAERKLQEILPTEEFTFEVLQTPAVRYGREYQLGDIVRTNHSGKIHTHKVRGVNIAYTRDRLEKIDVDLQAIVVPDVVLGWRLIQQLGAEEIVFDMVSLGGDAILAGTYPNGQVYRSANNGLTWDLTGQIASETTVYCFLVLSDTSILAGTSDGRIYRSTNSGTSWSLVQRLGSESSVQSLVDAGSGILLAGTGTGGRVYRSTNNGTSWSSVGRLGTESVIRALTNLGSGILLTGTAPGGRIYRSTNSGSSWSFIQRLGTETAVWSMLYLGDNIVLAGTSNGNVYRSTNGGTSWSLAQNLSDTTGVTALVDVGGEVLLAGGLNNAYVYSSTDAGISWQVVQRLGEEYAVWSMLYLGNNLVLASTGDTGQVYRSDKKGIEV